MSEKRRWFVDFLLEHYPDPNDIVRYSFSDDFITSLPYQDPLLLRTTMASLARFISHIQFESNKAKVDVIRFKRTIEKEKAKTILGLVDVNSRTTAATKQAMAYEQNPELAVMEEKLDILEENSKLYESLTGHLNEMIQVIKYELNWRMHNREGAYIHEANVRT
jgi:hypothetical protein